LWSEDSDGVAMGFDTEQCFVSTMSRTLGRVLRGKCVG